MFTMQEAKGGLEGLTVAIIGDIMHSRVARSNIIGLGKMGAKVRVFAPATLLPIGIENMGCQICSSLEEAISDADVIMGLRIQKERLKKALIPSTEEYARFFGLDVHHLAAAKKDVLVMHPGPVNRGVEMTSLLIDSDQSRINEQVTNGVAVRMALLYLLAGREEH